MTNNENEFDFRISIANRLERGISALTKEVTRICSRTSSIADIIGAIEALTLSPAWEKISDTQAYKMTTSVLVQNAHSWREAARKGQKSALIYSMLREELRQNGDFAGILRSNASYIRSVPSTVARDLTNYIGQQTIAGVRAESLVQHVKKQAPHLSATRTRLIARTETAKTWEAVTQVRATAIGRFYYTWETSEDGRVRSSHKHMQGVVCDYRHPPSPEELAPQAKDNPKTDIHFYNPGNIWNCRCSALPIIDEDDLPSIVKYHYNNEIIKIPRKELIALVDASRNTRS